MILVTGTKGIKKFSFKCSDFFSRRNWNVLSHNGMITANIIFILIIYTNIIRLIRIANVMRSRIH